ACAPERAAGLAADRGRLDGRARERQSGDAILLGWILSSGAALRGEPRAVVVELATVGPRPGFGWRGGEHTLAAQGIAALIMVDELEAAEELIEATFEDATKRGSLLGYVTAAGFLGAIKERRGDLRAAEGDLRLILEPVAGNPLATLGLVTMVHYFQDTILERAGLEDLVALIEAIELPPPAAATMAGALLLEPRGTLRIARGDVES